MELRHLRYFQVLAQELHFAKASEKLYITQPALTKQIQQLEEDIGVRLLERSKRKVRLTDAGAYFFHESQFMLNHLQQVIERTKRKAEGEDGEVRIGFVGSAMQNVIPELLERLDEKHPNIHTVLDELNNKDQLEAIYKDKIDIGFVRLESIPQQLENLAVYEDSFSLVVPQEHSVCLDGFKSLADLKEESFILFSNDYSQEYFNNVMSIFSDHGFEPKVSHRSVQANSIFRLVEKGLGVAIVPSAMQNGVDLEIEFISLAHLNQRTKLHAIWDPKNRNEALKKFLRLLG